MSKPKEEDVREIALRTFKEYMDHHKDSALAWHIWKKAFDIAMIEFSGQKDTQSIEFAKWILDEGFERSNIHSALWFKIGGSITSQELFERFKAEHYKLK